MNMFVIPFTTDRHPLEPHLPSILFPDIALCPPTTAQDSDQEQEDSTEGRSDCDEDRLVPLEPARYTATCVALLDVWWTRGSEVIEERLAAGRIDTLQSDLDKIIVSLDDFCGREELDVWVSDFILLAVDEVTEINEHIGIPD